MTEAHLDGGAAAGRTRQRDGDTGSSSSDGEHWHSTPASPTATATATPTATPAAPGEDRSPALEKAVAEAGPLPATASRDQGGARPGSAMGEQGSWRQGQGWASGPAAADDAFSDIALEDQRPPSAAAASDAAEAARVFATPPMPSTPTVPPLPARPRRARLSTASLLDDDDADDDMAAGPASAPGRHSVPPPLPPRSSVPSPNGAPAFSPPPPHRRGAQPRQGGARPASLVSVVGGGGGGTASPSSSTTASPRSSAFFSPSYLNRALPQTPTSVMGGSRPTSYGYSFSPTTVLTSYGSARTRPLSLPMDVPRPLRLQPSPLVRRGTSTPGGSGSGAEGRAGGSSSPNGDGGGGGPAYDMVWLRAHQSAARMARRRQHEQRMSADAYREHRKQLESREGAFEVLACFLQRLARAENEALEPDNFPRSFAEQQHQKEAMATMRHETVEALAPLLVYGPSTSTSTSSAAKPKAAPGTTHGLPPTPPLSPHRGNARRVSGMSSLTETSLGDDSRPQDDDGAGGDERAPAAMWRSSMKRASALFGWGASGSTAPPAARFSGE